MWNKVVKAAERSIFSTLAKLAPPTPRALVGNPRNIVVMSCTGIGDGLFDSAAIRSLKLGYPEAKVSVVAHRRRMTVALHNPYVDEVLPYSKSPIARWRILRKFLHRRPELVVALRVNTDAVPLGYLLNRHAFFGSIDRCRDFAFLLSHPIRPVAGSHAIVETLDVAKAAGGSADAPIAMIYEPLPAEQLAAETRFGDWIHAPFIAWQSGGGRSLSYRDWPPDRIIEAIKILRQKTPHRIVLTGGKDNLEASNAIERACPEVVNLCCKTTLEETAVVVKNAAMLVSSDTGVMHLGFAIGTPTLALLHPKSRPELYGPPQGDERFEVIHVLGEAGGRSEDAMKNLHADEVVSAILRRLKIGK